MPAATLAKHGNKWIVSYPGRFGERSSRFKTKRDAQAALIEIEKQADWEARLLAMDATGQYTLTPEQDAETDALAAALRENRTRKTFSGEQTFQESARKEHDSDARIIESWQAFQPTISEHGQLVCAELRLRRFARVEAFKRAGLSLSAN